MNAFVSQPSGRMPSRIGRWGLALATAAIAYIAAVIVFIVVY